MRVTVWNEFVHEREDEEVLAIYPDGIHRHLAGELARDTDWQVRTATLDQPENGLPQSVIDETDVLIWWGHRAHGAVSDETVERVHNAVLDGMGFIALHSAHYSRPLKRLLGTGCGLSWRVDGRHERLWVVDPTHPIAAGIDGYFEIPQTEMLWKRGRGKIFYFRPGHETYPIYHQPEVLTVIRNACRYLHADDLPKVTGIGNAPHVTVSPEDKRKDGAGGA